MNHLPILKSHLCRLIVPALLSATRVWQRVSLPSRHLVWMLNVPAQALAQVQVLVLVLVLVPAQAQA